MRAAKVQRRFRQACASTQFARTFAARSYKQWVKSQEEPSDRKPDPWPLWMAGHAQLKFVMTECSKTQIRLTGLIWNESYCDKHLFTLIIEPQLDKTTKMSVRPAKNQISLGIRPVWSESSLSAWGKLGSLATPERTPMTLIRLGECPGYLSLRWVYSHFVGFVMSRLI